ncbi:MAG TPA: hypothetical protein VE398_22135, partial [Acidobacteriota bacterium]|nr:hypothetical protein [Acidobacteriota bacterium]
SLARGHYAPPGLGRLSSKGVPHRALAASSLGMAVAILLAIYVPKRAFLLMYGSAVSGMYFVWIVILLAHLRFRRSIGTKINELPLKLRMFPISNVMGILILVALGISTFFVEGLQYSIPIFAVLLVVMSGMYWNVRRNPKFVEAAEVEMAPESPATGP